MKKVILYIRVFAIILFSGIGITAIGQVPQYYDSWMFNEVINQGCISLPLSHEEALHKTVGICNLLNGDAYAQPYFTDSIISIKGIAILGSWFIDPDDKEELYLQIRDSSLNNIFAQIRYDTIPFPVSTTPPWNANCNSFKELLFDSSIFINANKFYTVMTSSSSFDSFTGVISFIFLTDSCKVTEKPKWYTNGQWTEITVPNFNQPPLGLALFPILDTLTYPEQNDISVINSEVEINIYPNPAKNELNVSSSIEIAKIEILNILGQLVFTKELKSKNTKINISILPKGNYIAKIHTTKGVRTTKFVVK
ncbi:MAG TPA: hypothetical protein DD434_05965 [Bacteroidales bacterium]|nr:hypothetical protein [Bacteroidales bacterium]